MLVACLLFGAALFVLGVVGFVTRRNLIVMFLCTELMFQGIIVTLVAFDRFPLRSAEAVAVAPAGQSFSLLLLAVAAAEAALALAFVVLLYRFRGTLDAGAWRTLKDD